VVDATTLAPVGELRGHDAAPRGLAAVGATQLLSVSRDGSVAFWDVAARRLIARADVPGGAWSVAAGNGVALVGTRAGSLCRLRLPDLALERTAPIHAGAVGAVVALPDGRAATGGDDRAVRLVDPEVAGTTRPSHAGPITALADPGRGALRLAPASPGLAQGERIIVTGGGDGTVKVWDTQRGRSLRTIPSHPGGVASVAAVQRPDGLAVFASSGAAVIEHRLSAAGVVGSQPIAPAPAAIRRLAAVSPDELVATCRDGTARTWTRAAGWGAPAPADAEPGPATAPSGRVATATRDDCVVVSTPDGAVVARWTCDAAPQALAFLDERTLVVGDAAGELAILDVP
jgi:cytochrome c